MAARALGFKTGDVSLVLTSMDGSHQGAVQIFCEQITPALEEVIDFLKRRVMVHLAGVLSQWPEPLKNQRHVSAALEEEGGESDLQKARELVQVLLNINGDFTPEGPAVMLDRIAMDANVLITHNFPAIRALAARFAANIDFYGQRFAWKAAEIKTQPEIASISLPQRSRLPQK